MGDKGYFIEPTVFANVQDDMKIARVLHSPNSPPLLSGHNHRSTVSHPTALACLDMQGTRLDWRQAVQGCSSFRCAAYVTGVTCTPGS